MNKFMKHILVVCGMCTALSLTACGYQPLYATRDDGSSVAGDLSRVSVQQQDTRVGQLVRNEFVQSTRPAGVEAENRYFLKFATKGSSQTLIDTSDTVHRRLAYNLAADFHLVDASTQQTVFSGRAFSKVPYDRLSASFANVQARVNAEEQAARQVGQEMRTRVAAYLSKP